MPMMARNQRLRGSITKVNPASPRNHGKGREMVELLHDSDANSKKIQPVIVRSGNAGPEYFRLSRPATATVIQRRMALPHQSVGLQKSS